MRIISGTHKGRKIMAPKNLPSRPTTDMAKEALFNILNNRYYFDELKVLDLYSGIGSISFEFASRGTTSITAVDKHRGCVKFIAETAELLDLPIQVVADDAMKFIKRNRSSYTIIFADPPYKNDVSIFLELVDIVFDNNLLEDGGTLIVEHSKHTVLAEHKRHIQTKTYGGSSFSFFE
ncbi:MAG: 16S rRNA (guanine(966)-N(2))-methyltransferase RsmD [Flavobacteriaceae bacterium]|nr:16S rRNA (guanine(966)-N(2))-methyltransferase RsmD [Bacteroidia bacterium]NNF73888.1 16S rRNA (guanine(966)-N(2))-methyltransferase RsmD [Flavobacteriaceae bacterium]NNK74248.1 16S rRNA (guanine(966)-N(2))-methyltransferase RsmD [Flavobacteriaceae bacterium]